MKTMKIEDLQVHLDLQKWHASENEGKDMCRHMQYCVFCQWEEDNKCALAYLRMVEEEEKKASAKKAAPAKKATATTKPAAAKKAPAKAPAAKAAPAKKAPAKKK